MDGLKRLMACAVLAFAAGVVGSGCTSHVTNFTPTALPREASGLYHFEAEWTSTQRTRELRADTIRGWVVLDHQFYPMEPVSRLKDRWESEVPIPASVNAVYYYFKWDYQTAGFGHNNPNSTRSKLYRVEVADPVPK